MRTSLYHLAASLPLPLRRAAAAAGAIAVAAASLAPMSKLPRTGLWAIPHMDKVAHVLMYAMLATLLALAYPLRDGIRTARLAAILVACIGYGALLECAQASIPSLGRCFSPADIAANAFGAIAGVLICRQALGLPAPATGTLQTSHC